MTYIKIDTGLRIGEKAILDGDTERPVIVKWVGDIFALVRCPHTHNEWTVMANRLKAEGTNTVQGREQRYEGVRV